jgi:hypothetical protein
MSKTKPKTLQAWMVENNKTDSDVARHVRLHRVQISRIRRGLSFASIKTAMRLQQLTRINWQHFVKTPRLEQPQRRVAR